MTSKREPRIVNPATHPRSTVCLAVAADYLGIDPRTLRRHIEAGRMAAWRFGKVYRIAVLDLVALASLPPKAYDRAGIGGRPKKVSRPTARSTRSARSSVHTADRPLSDSLE